MRVSKSKAALLALPASTLAVSLSDFTPRVSNLPAGCKSVYTKTIDGCSSTDFGSDGCSAACVEGLQGIAASVKGACGNKDITGQNIIVAYLSGQGPGSLCPNAASILGGSSSSSSSADSTSSAAASSSSLSSASSTPTSTMASSASTELSGTATASSLTTAPTDSSTTGLLVDTSSTPTSGMASRTSSSQGSSQTNDGQSGGGSPFDTSGNLASVATLASMSIGAAILAGSMMLHAVVW